jgi:hypothetical protein
MFGRWWRRVRDWYTLSKLGDVADLLLKITAIIAALAAANFFFFRPHVELTTHSQAFIDVDRLAAVYRADHKPLPPIVAGVAATYNAANTEDLATGLNSTHSRIPGARLCSDSRATVQAVFPGTDCDASVPVLGRGRMYERLLLFRNAQQGTPLSASQLRDAIGRLQRAEFLKVLCTTSNDGNAKAVNVKIRASDGFFRTADQVNAPFSLEAGDQVHYLFLSRPGEFVRDPALEFGVDWDRGSLTDTGPATIVAAILLIAFVLVLLNDFKSSARAKREESGDEPAPH